MNNNKELTPFGKSLGEFWPNLVNHFTSLTGWVETEGGYELHVDMPGVEKKDIKIEFSEGYVEINAERVTKTKTGEHSRSYSNAFLIPKYVDGESVEAEYKDGVLTLFAKALKAEEMTPKRKAIEVK